MTGFAYRVDQGQATTIPIREAIATQARLVWVHLETNDAVAQRWLSDSAHVGDYVVDALTATETRAPGARRWARGRSSIFAGGAANRSTDPTCSPRCGSGR
ncbi:hypothetical protein QE363_000522 [Sphingomonas sp. SORGH_AS870]|nr:hypothetical protein [Sphingomonas sp. SORGH_AS_0870]